METLRPGDEHIEAWMNEVGKYLEKMGPLKNSAEVELCIHIC